MATVLSPSSVPQPKCFTDWVIAQQEAALPHPDDIDANWEWELRASRAADAHVLALPLRQWLETEAAWYRQDEGGPASELIADAITDLARSVEFHRAQSVSELVERSARCRTFDPDAEIEIPDPPSGLAEAIADEVHGFVKLGGDAAKLVAWWLAAIAGEADYYEAETMQDLYDSRAAYENALIDALPPIDLVDPYLP